MYNKSLAIRVAKDIIIIIIVLQNEKATYK